MHVKSVSYKEKERVLMRALKVARPLAALKDFCGTAAAPFVGRFGYPNVNVGLLAPPEVKENVWEFDAPRHWANTNQQIQQVVEYRAQLVNSAQVSNIKQVSKVVEIAQEVAMAQNADIEVALEKQSRLNISTDQWVAPMGPQGKIKSVQLTSNPHIPTKVQRFFDDTDVKASEAITSLYNEPGDENALSRMLSVGVFGKQRKLVPTRWSITATDDMLANDVLGHVKKLPVGECQAYFGGYVGNYYLFIFLPEDYRYELFEMYVSPGKTLEYSTDFEPFEGRKSYAKQCAGGFYSVRLAIAEHLRDQKRQNSVLALRFITDEYVLPLGVWVTREASRKALSAKPIAFGSKELALKYAESLARKKFGVDVTELLKKSIILKQKSPSLNAWF